MKIFKYPLQLVQIQNVKLPKFAEIQHVGRTSGGLFLWALVDEGLPNDMHTIYIFGTGQSISGDLLEKLVRLGTVIDEDEFVWHVFLKVS